MLRYSTSMAANSSRLNSIVEDYLRDLRRVRGSGGTTAGRSTHGAFDRSFNSIVGRLRPQLFCVHELDGQGAGHPDFGLYSATQIQQGAPWQWQLL